MDAGDKFASQTIYVFFGFFLLVFGLIYWQIVEATEPKEASTTVEQQR